MNGEQAQISESIIRKIVSNGCEEVGEYGGSTCFFCGGKMEYGKPPNAGRIIKENHSHDCPYEQARKFLEEIDA